jgi:hypothetical protein
VPRAAVWQGEKLMAVNKAGEFMDQKKAPAKNKFKGVRRER